MKNWMLWWQRARCVSMAPDAGIAGGGSAADGINGPTGGASADAQAERTFTQADIDRILTRERAKWGRAQERAVSEAEHLARVNADERAREEERRREETLSRREREITRRELRAQALETLASQRMPAQLADLLDYGDAERCSASLDMVKKTWQGAVQQGVEARIAGPAPKDGSGKRGGPQSLRDAISGYYNK